jgi:PAS domain S-box-containing protein
MGGVLLSLLTGIVSSAVALFVAGRGEMGPFKLLTGSLFAGAGILIPHRGGMAAGRIPAIFLYSPSLTALPAAAAIGKASRTACPSALPMGAALLGITPASMVSVSLPVVMAIGAASCLALAIALLVRFLNRLREQKTLLNELFEQAPLAVALTTLEHRIIRVNRGFTQVFGYTPQGAIGGRIGELIVPPESQDEYRRHADAVARGERVDTEGIRCRQDGSRFPAAITYVPFASPGRETAVYAIYRDITERRRGEEARSAGEQRWRAIFDNSAVGITVTDLYGKFTDTNRAYREMVGYSEEELRAITYMDLTWEEDRPANAALSADIWNGRLPKFLLEKRYRRKDGQSIWVRITVSKSPGEGSAPPIGIAVVEDVTERKQAEARLLEYEKVVEGLQEMIVVLDREYRYVVANQAFLNYHGLRREQVVGHFVPEFVGQERFNQVTKSNVDRCFQGKVVRCEMEFTFPNLGRRDLFGSYYPIEGPAGVDRIAVVLEDITEWKRAEARLLEYEKVVESSQEMIAVVDRDYRYLIANRAFLDYRGMQPEEVVGRSVPEILGRETFDRIVKSKLDECLQGNVVQYELEYTYSQRGRRDLFATYFPIQGPNGIDRVAVALQDVTERKRAERELQRSLQELHALNAQLQSVREEERTRLARELHDELGQALTAIRIDLAGLKSARGQESQRIDGVLSLVDETIRSVRRISTELRPGILDHLGLVAAVEWAAEEFQSRTGIQCRVSLPETNPAIDAERATALFRIFQETLTNIARHAGATAVRVALSLESGNVSLEVRDNGRGISEDQLAASGSLGILGMRERALLLGGEFSIAGDPGTGAIVRVRIPVADPPLPEANP